jgi:hypothetical protein
MECGFEFNMDESETNQNSDPKDILWGVGFLVFGLYLLAGAVFTIKKGVWLIKGVRPL